MNHRKLLSGLTLLFLLLQLSCLGLLICLGAMQNSDRFHRREYFSPSPVRNYETLEEPCADSPIGVMRIYRWRLPEKPKPGMDLAITAYHQYLRVYVGDELQYSLMPSESSRVSKTLGNTWVFVPIHHDDYGREIRVEVLPVYESARERVPEFKLGSEMQIAWSTAVRELPLLLLGISIAVVGLCFLVLGLISHKNWRRDLSLCFMGAFAMHIGIWRLCDSWSLSLMFPHTTVLAYHVSMFALMLCPVPLIKTTLPNLHPKCRPVAEAYAGLTFVVFLLQLLLQILDIADLRETLPLTHVTLFACGFVLLGCAVYSSRHKNWKPAAPGGHLVAICLIGAAFDLVLYYLRGDSTGLIGLMAAFLVYLLVYAVQMLVHYSRMETRMLENRTAIMLSQIQPHFMFNSLTAIAQLCEKDPRQAKKTIISFSEYLRGNMESIRRTKLVSFQRELEHLRRYIALEQLRFGDELAVEYDLECKDFSLPALTVQPLVENAIKHGIGQKNGGGTVFISTRETESASIIEVRDDGVGFDVNAAPDDGRSHIGISNVTERLRLMCGGTLEIESEAGKGTCVRVTIPKGASVRISE